MDRMNVLPSKFPHLKLGSEVGIKQGRSGTFTGVLSFDTTVHSVDTTVHGVKFGFGIKICFDVEFTPVPVCSRTSGRIGESLLHVDMTDQLVWSQ